MTRQTAPSSADHPLTDAQRQQINAAADLTRIIRGADRLATFNGKSLVIGAVICAMFALFDTTSAVLTVALGALAYNEFRGRSALRWFDPSAGRILAVNQLILALVIVAYCGWSIYANLYGPGSFNDRSSEYARLLGPNSGIEKSVRDLTIGFYTSIALLSLLFQGLSASYYLRRCKAMTEAVKETPEWVLDLARRLKSE